VHRVPQWRTQIDVLDLEVLARPQVWVTQLATFSLKRPSRVVLEMT
jgi:hypothetical protein